MRPFVGRDPQLARLRERLAGLTALDGGVLLLTGPAGIGKTRLAEEGLATAPSGCPIGRGHCVAEGAPPMWPWRRAIRSAAVRADPDAADALDRAERLLPGEAELPGPADAAGAASIRLRALADVTDALVTAALRTPLVLLLEDLHWADLGSLDLLAELAGQLAGVPLLVIGTHRDVPEELAPALTGVLRHDRAEALPLPALAEPDVRRYLLGIGADDVPAARVTARSGGLPLLLEAATSQAGVERVPLDAGAVAAGLIAPLTTAQRAVLAAAAVLGPVLDEGLTARVAEVDRPQVVAGQEAALRSGLLVRGGGGAGTSDRYRFAHALWQQAVAEAIPPEDRRTLHRRAAGTLAAASGPGTGTGLAAMIAAHWRAAGDDAEALAEVVRWSRRAAADAFRALAPADAAGHLATAVEALDRAGAAPEASADAGIELARAHYLAGAYLEALQQCRQASRLAEQAGSADLAATAALVVQGVTFPQARTAIRALGRTALRLSQAGGTPLPSPVRSRLHAQLAVMAADEGDVVPARLDADRAMQLARAADDPQALLDAVRARELTLNDAGDMPERLALGDLAVEQAERLGRPLDAVIAHGWRLGAGYLLGQPDVVEDADARVAAIADHTRLPLARWHQLRIRAGRAALEGRFDEAREANDQAERLAARSGDRTAAGMSGAHRHHLAMLRGDPGEFGPLEPLLLTAPPMPLITSARAIVLLMAGRRDEAAVEYERALSDLRAAVKDARWGGFLLQFAELVTMVGDADAAALLAAHLEPWANYPGAAGTATAYFSGNPARHYGMLLGMTGRTGEARAALELAVRRNTASGARPHAVLARLDLADLLLRYVPSALGEATAQARQAASEARRLDMPGPLARADVLLARASAAGRSADPLSRREREVADLVVQALSNRQIAERLVLSERTVESHVRSILAKLGCANRAELILRLAGSGPR